MENALRLKLETVDGETGEAELVSDWTLPNTMTTHEAVEMVQVLADIVDDVIGQEDAG